MPHEVRATDVADVVARRAGIPISRMMESERDRLLKLEERLGSRVIGQPEAVDALAEAARRMRADLRKKRKPASFLFVGPTGVGKTTRQRPCRGAVRRRKRPNSDRYGRVQGLRIDFGVDRFEAGPRRLRARWVPDRAGPPLSLLGGAVRRNRKGPRRGDGSDVGLLDEGRLTDAKGRLCDFTNTIVLLTSNLGVKEANAVAKTNEERRDIIMKVVQ